ncbi:hypothetical protein KCMC57_up04530 [Kitasatospora sp. CMC57]|uniref:Uncharacterized protein n=1 Tax=Kitasatospora sp. CMC57 TaxID=3231513 RepID=A0AB33JLD2_9ACTN
MVLAWALIGLQIAAIATTAVRLTPSHRQDPTRVPLTAHRTWPPLLAANLLPSDAPVAAWGLWGATIIAAALAHGLADAP